MSNVVYGSCIPSPEPCNDTNTSSTSIEPAVIIIPLVLVGAGVWYWLSDSDEPLRGSANLKADDIYSPYSFSLAPLSNNELGGIQLKFGYEF
jgi:hypothetical protein